MLKGNLFGYTCVVLLSLLVFYLLYGSLVMNPTYVNWLMQGGDPNQHYLGWLAFRYSEWSFPIGNTNFLNYPNYSSIIFTDSIPCFAILFKLLSYLLPNTFQYFGWFGLMCFILQGVISFRILRYFIKNDLAAGIGSVFFLLFPIFLMRMFGHTALASQWLILLALEPILLYENFNKKSTIIIRILLLAVLASSIHIYFIFMCGLCLFAYCLKSILETKKFKFSVCLCILYSIISLLTISLLGGFTSNSSTFAIFGYGKLSANLNFLINPQGKSLLLESLPIYSPWQVEGFGYIGLGFITMLLICIFKFKRKLLSCFKRNWKTILPLLILIIISILYALSNIVTINNIKLFEIPLPKVIIHYLSIFRSTGRFIWIFEYILLISSIIILSKIFKQKTFILLLSLCLFIQVIDLSPMLLNVHTEFLNEKKYIKVISRKTLLNKIIETNNIKHVIITDWMAEETFYQLGNLILTNYDKITLNSFAMAHPDEEKMFKSVDFSLSNPINDELYIFPPYTVHDLRNYDLHYYNIGALVVGVKTPVKNCKEMTKKEVEEYVKTILSQI